jgi:hypothetical protein
LRDQGQSGNYLIAFMGSSILKLNVFLGFLLPEDQIVSSGLETFEAVKALAFYIKKNLGLTA